MIYFKTFIFIFLLTFLFWGKCFIRDIFYIVKGKCFSVPLMLCEKQGHYFLQQVFLTSSLTIRTLNSVPQVSRSHRKENVA